MVICESITVDAEPTAAVALEDDSDFLFVGVASVVDAAAVVCRVMAA